MITIQNNSDFNFTSIRAIAAEVWPIAYGSILSRAQLDYMMEMMYSVSSLQKQVLVNNNQFVIAYDNDIPVGFASFEYNHENEPNTKIHKIYVLSSSQKTGIGKLLIDFICTEARKEKQVKLVLNVNKNNIAQHFYSKHGFVITQEVVIAIGNGFIMDDYTMEKNIFTL